MSLTPFQEKPQSTSGTLGEFSFHDRGKVLKHVEHKISNTLKIYSADLASRERIE